MRLTILLAIIFMCGCAPLWNLMHESADVTADEVQGSDTALAAAAMQFVPPPYNIAAAYAAGYITSLIRRWYKKRQGAAA
jgi:hypothetical protein